MTTGTVTFTVTDRSGHTASLPLTYTAGPAPVQPSAAYPTVGWASLYRSGDTFNAAVARLSTPTQVLLPPGLYEFTDFTQGGAAYGVYSANMQGLIGTSGKASDVIVRMKPHASTKSAPTSGTNQLTLLRCNQGAVTVGNLTLEGTDQGHAYNGLSIYQAAPGTVVGNLKVTGIPGTANYPPGETFAINLYRAAGTSANPVRLRDIDVTGIRTADGVKVGASPIGWNGCTWVDLTDGYFHDTLTSMPTFWQSTDCTTTRLRSVHCGTGSGALSGCGINHEESTRITHRSPTLLVDRVGVSYQHLQVLSQTSDCQVTVTDPIFDHPAYVGGNQFTVMIAANYGTGEKVTGNLISVTAAGRPVPTKIYH